MRTISGIANYVRSCFALYEEPLRTLSREAGEEDEAWLEEWCKHGVEEDLVGDAEWMQGNI